MRLYIVRDTTEEDCALVVANNAKEAKRIGRAELMSEFISTTVNWIRGVEMANNQEGLYTDYANALKNGWFYFAYMQCPVCGDLDARIEYDEEKEMFYCSSCSKYFELNEVK